MSVRVKLTAIFMAIAVFPLLFVSALTYHNYRDSIETVRLTNLRDIAAFKADRIETYFAGLKADIEIAQGFYNIKKNLPLLSSLANQPSNPEFIVAKKTLDGQLRQMQDVLGLADIMLLNTESEVVYASNPGHANELFNAFPDPQHKAFSEGKRKVYFSDIFARQADANVFEMLVTAPAADFNGVFIGVIAFEVNMRATLYKLVRDATGLGTTGETLLGKKIDNDVIYLNPLRHDPQATLKRKVSLREKFGGPVQEAAQGRQGAGQLLDYRGKKVIAAWRYLPSLDWGMVAKIDADETFADAVTLRNLAIIIIVIVLVLSGIMAFSIARSIADPIKKLSEGAELIGHGNLDHRIEINAQDEIGQLALSFNRMTEDLKTTTASRDDLNREIAERRKTQEALLETANNLARSNRDLEQFAYVASHDLQEPLRAVAGFVSLLKMKLKASLDEKTTEYMTFITDGTSRMQTLINGLLEYSRVDTQGKRPEPADAKTALDRAIRNLQVSVVESHAKISADNLPTLRVDGTQLTQLFQNLIGNAIKFRGEKPPQITVSAARQADAWQFAVSDNGIGLEKQYADRIFLIFQRLHTRDKYPGTGIGLAICKKIVERHGGRIWVESQPDRGSTFYFTISDKGET